MQSGLQTTAHQFSKSEIDNSLDEPKSRSEIFIFSEMTHSKFPLGNFKTSIFENCASSKMPF